MKTIVSVKALLSTLNELDVDNHPVQSTIATKGAILFVSDEKSAKLECDFEGVHVHSQSNAKWNWVKDLMKATVEQPIILEINEQSVNVIFQY